MCQIGWRNGVNIDLFKKEVSLHLQEVRRWRELEGSLHSDAVQYKASLIVLSYDDTSALELPRFGNREPKGLKSGCVAYVPWNISNHGARENHYFYMLKQKLSKGGNRICTFLYFYLRRLKFFDMCQLNCRRLMSYIVGFSESSHSLEVV